MGCGLYNVKAYAVSQRKRETAPVSRSVRNHAGMRTDARENKNPIRSYFTKSDSDRCLFKLAVRLRPLRKMSATERGLFW